MSRHTNPKTELMNQKIGRYLAYRYPVTIYAIPEEEGGGFAAMIPQLGDRAFIGVGDTEEEARAALEDIREHLIPELLKEGVELPEPKDPRQPFKAENFSGNVLLRLPKALHQALNAEAMVNGCSVNKLATELLSRGLAQREIMNELLNPAFLDRLIEEVTRRERPAQSPSATSASTSGQRWQKPILRIQDTSEDEFAADQNCRVA